MAAFGIGIILGGGLTVFMSKKIKPQMLLALGLVASAVSFSGMGMSNVLWLTLAYQFLSGLFMPCVNISINTLILENTEEAFIGRVNGILNPLFTGAMVISMSVGGWLKLHLSIVLIYELAALILFAGVATLLPIVKKSAKNQEISKGV
ncbi:MFS transporter [Fictibacillus sp. NRS-1165]|uniref:MFS transporter n=1 Tax=Fictibacillus sp. NRS-1165 TaxID=3144463 RepID=UPI003D20BDBE